MPKKIMYMAPVEYMSGKFANNGDKVTKETEGENSFFIASNRSYVTTAKTRKYFSLRLRANKKAATQAQEQNRLVFVQCIALMKTIFADETKLAALTARFKAQSKYSTLRGFAFAEARQEIIG